MQPHTATRLPRWTLVGIFVLTFACAWSLGARLAAPGLGPYRDADAMATSPRAAMATTRDEPSGEAAPVREAAGPADGHAAMTFAQRIDELVTIGMRTSEFAQQDEIAAARASDEQARRRFDELMQAFPDAGERALDLLATIADDESGKSAVGRPLVLQLVVQHELQRRGLAADAADDRSRIHAFTQAILDMMPGTATLTRVGRAALHKQPWLRAVHEQGVLALVRLAGEEKFPRQTATDLLLTLWDNLQRFGEVSSEELARLALLLLGNSDASQQIAACRQLLRDARYRHMVLAWLRAKNDALLTGEIAAVAARELSVADALEVLRALSGLSGRITHAYLSLGARSPCETADDYRRLLASDVEPVVRADLVTGVGMANTALGREIAELAFDNDPSPDVKVQAVFALTAKRDAGLAEQALMRALDNPAIADDQRRLGAMVLALENLAALGDANATERVGRRLAAMPLLAEMRSRLDSILARSVPGGLPGGTSGGIPGSVDPGGR